MADKERCHKSEELHNSNETYGKPALYPHLLLPLVHKLNQRPMQ